MKHHSYLIVQAGIIENEISRIGSGGFRESPFGRKRWGFMGFKILFVQEESNKKPLSA